MFPVPHTIRPAQTHTSSSKFRFIISNSARLFLTAFFALGLWSEARAQLLTKKTQLLDSTSDNYEEFGASVAINGDTAVVGTGDNQQHRYVTVYVRTASGWTQQARFAAPMPGPLALDGDTLVASNNVYVRNGTDWSLQASLPVPVGLSWSAAISGDTVAFGNYAESGSSRDTSPPGAVYVFVRNGTTWTQQARLNSTVGSDQEAGFGLSVAIDGDTLVAGEPWGGVTAAYVFVRNGTTWTQQARLTASQPVGNFGWSAAVQGNTAVIGAYGGAVHVFNRSGTSWSVTQVLQADTQPSGDKFGESVSLDGGLIAVTDPTENSGQSLYASYLFSLTNSGWRQVQKFTDGSFTFETGGIRISGSTVIVGDPFYSSSGMTSDGTAFIYEPDAVPLPSGTWQSQDIGTVGQPGSSAQSGDGFTISGSGADVWGTSDAFRFTSQTVTGDATIVARVTSIGDTDAWAKAGLMVREGTGASSRNVFLFSSPQNNAAFQNRSSDGGDTASTSPTYTWLPLWLKLTRSGNTFTGYQSEDGVNWTVAGSVTADMASTVYVGLAVTSHNDSALCTATFDQVAINAGSSSPPPNTTWQDADIGAVGLAGSDDASGNPVTVAGSGADIWDTADAFRFVYQAWHGDGQIITRVDSISDTDDWAKAGIMFRETLDGSSKNVFIFITPNSVSAFQDRSAAGATTDFAMASWSVPTGTWLRLVRSGDTFTAYLSSDGSTWTAAGSTTVSMSTDIYAGLAATAHNNAALNTATFFSPSVSP